MRKNSQSSDSFRDEFKKTFSHYHCHFHHCRSAIRYERLKFLYPYNLTKDLLLKLITAFIFDTANDHDIMNYKYGDECFQNQTVMDTVNEFKRNFDIIKVLSRREVRSVRRRGFETVFADVCEAKRNVARTMTDCIQPTADFCVGDEKVRKEFVLNTLMILQTTLDYICGMNQSVFEDIYDLSCEECLTANMQQLQLCQRNSFDLYFWEQVPEKLPTITHLINGAVCK